MPGLDSDVFWGDPDKPPPDWRDHPIPDAHEDDDEYSEDATPERRKWVHELAGFDPYEDDETEDEPADTNEPSADTAPLHETAPETASDRLARKAAELWSKDYP